MGETADIMAIIGGNVLLLISTSCPHYSGSGSFPTTVYCADMEKIDDFADCTLLAHGHRAITAALRHTGNEMESHFSNFHQCLIKPSGPLWL